MLGAAAPPRSISAAFTRRNTPFRLGSKRTSFVASVPTSAIRPLAGFTPSAMQMFISRST